jgi:hypothetical protein
MTHPEIHPFYETPDKMKRGGKKKKAKKAKVATNINTQKVNVNIDLGKLKHHVDKVVHAKHKAITSTSRLLTPNVQFANPPKSQLPSYFAVPNGVGLIDPVSRQNFQGDGNMRAEDVRYRAPLGSAPNPSQVPNRTGLASVDTRAQRAIPTSHATGGVMSSNPFSIGALEPVAKQPRVNTVFYFPPAGRDNAPRPQQNQLTAPPSGFFPLQAQQPETREVEMRREAERDIPVSYDPRSSFELFTGDTEFKLRTMKKGNPRYAGIQSGEKYIEQDNTAVKFREYERRKKIGEKDGDLYGEKRMGGRVSQSQSVF